MSSEAEPRRAADGSTGSSDEEPSSSRTASVVKLALLVALIGGGVWFFRFTETGRQVNPTNVLKWFRSFDLLTAAPIYVGVYMLGTVLLVPGTALSVAGALIFGAWWGTLLTWVGATIGASLAFFAARLLGRDFVDRIAQGKLETLDRTVAKKGFVGVLLLRLLFFPFNALNFGCGLTGIGFRDYLLATAIGILPGTFVFQFLFAKLGEAAMDRGLNWSAVGAVLTEPQVLVALALFAVFLVGGNVLAKRFSPAADDNDADEGPDA